MTQHRKIPLIFTTLFILSSSSIARYIITPTAPLHDNETLVSASGSFALGFFNPDTEKRYIGLWYNNIPERIVMVVNRANPLVNSSGVLSITQNGTLTITDKDSRVVWSSNTTTKLTNPTARLLDNGNLIIEDGLNYAWQSFDHPTDTLLPGMKLGVDFTTGLNRTLTSWSSSTDPTHGAYQVYMETSGEPEIFVVKGTRRIWRNGPWDGAHFCGVPYTWSYQGFHFSFINSKSSVTYSYEVEPSIITTLYVTSSGNYQRFNWMKDRKQWSYQWSALKDDCDQIGACGNYGVCDMNRSPECNCITGFEPKNPVKWNTQSDGSDGCIRKHEFDCENGTDGFVVVALAKLPQLENCKVDLSSSLDQCRHLCLSDCSCTAYASAIYTNNTGCVIWVGELYDVRTYDNNAQDLYVRVNAMDVPKSSPGGKSHARAVIVVAVASLVAGILLLSCVLCTRKKVLGVMNPLGKQFGHEQKGESIDLPMFSIDAINRATNYFSSENKVGEGGFGPVYKGKLQDDQEIAVKRLSKTSRQGSEEFKTEVMLIAKLQHRNLVSLLGCCIEGEERMLVYEYLPNNSLDAFLFDGEKRSLLNWNMRYQIITGIARGLVYLHRDSRFRIIHRDLKAGNVLLDKEMVPKISDFGMARIFSDDEIDINTRKIVGTYGYMSPEYAMKGVFSMKSDVFSFGVLVLEIISGKKNRGAYSVPLHINLLSHAWSLWKEGNGMEIVDNSLNSFSTHEVLGCIKLGLLCVQEHPEDRPLMSSVIKMFGNNMKTSREPTQPGFIATSYDPFGDLDACSNDLSFTVFEPR